VAETVQRALDEIGPLVDGSIEVLIVDDGSTDRTPELADALVVADPRVRVHHQENRGYGGALRAGFATAAGELICFSDGDLQFDLREMSRLVERLDDPSRKRVDAVIGYRIKRRDPPHRIFIAKTYNAIVSVLFGLRVRDIDCAMKLFRREVFDGLPLETDSPFLSAELLIKLRARRERIAQVGVNHYPRAAGTNTGASFRKILRTFRDIGRLRLALWMRRSAVLGTPRAR
jgi:glycosyltransferase involved in cell wall biosynthesis